MYCLWCYSLTYGQSSTIDRAIVYYEDGSVFIGEILEEDRRFVRLVLATDDTIKVNKSFIKRTRYARDITIHQKGKFHFSRGFFMNLSYGVGFSSFNSSVLTDFVAGTRLSSKYAVGLGIGIHLHSRFLGDFNWVSDQFTPVYLYGRYYPWNKRIKPFADISTGFGFSTNRGFGATHTGGFLFSPGIGLNFAARRNFRFLLSLNQMIQNTSGTDFAFDRFGNQVELDYRVWYNRTVIKFVLEFR